MNLTEVVNLSKHRLALLHSKPMFVEVCETDFFKCWYIKRAIVFSHTLKKFCELSDEMSSYEKLVSENKLMFLDDSKELNRLYQIVDEKTGQRWNKKIYVWYICRSGRLILANKTKRDEEQTVCTYVLWEDECMRLFKIPNLPNLIQLPFAAGITLDDFMRISQ